MLRRQIARFVLAAVAGALAAYAAEGKLWTKEQANDWYRAQPWLVGANYNPATAINQLEMWQEETFDPKRIDLELGWAEGLGMNTMRVFLHDLLWQQDQAAFTRRLQTFLEIAAKHNIRPMFVLFDSVWDPHPELGQQRAPKPGVHNSGWVQGPGAKALTDPAQYPRLEAYVKGVARAFANDKRVLAWDVWNEPDNLNGSSYRAQEPAKKVELVLALLPRVFQWAREAGVEQPLTGGVWQGDWSAPEKLSATDRVLLDNSDVVSFHSYDPPEKFEQRVQALERYGRPLLCTEYMARGNGSTFQGTMPIAGKYNVALYNWGLVAGKTQTNLPWDSWQKPYTGGREPKVWFHEIFHPDGRPYRQEEVEFIRQMTSRKAKAAGAR
ncbi:MAG: cellulase family glycosylhydrolase [Bryobacteraceae bacterium]|nr:cellulase family glycosylhydrolase [Bryobacteraceae bacterium]